MLFYFIILFFILLALFFPVCGLWHWIWFGRGEDFLRIRLGPAIFPRAADRPQVITNFVIAVRAGTVGLVIFVLAGLALVIFRMLN